MTISMKTLHNDALKSLIAIQYYMSTISTNSNDNMRTTQYLQCLELMSKAVNLMIQTTAIPNENNKKDEYPHELLLVINNLNNIHQKIDFLKENNDFMNNKNENINENKKFLTETNN